MRIRRFIENNHVEHLQQQDQTKLLFELPSYLRSQVISHTHGEIVRKIRFFDEKSQEFIWAMLPLLSQIKVYSKDVLYGQGDQSAEIFFIIRGRVKFFYNVNFKDVHALPNNVPINLHVEGSYFGDNDVLLNQGRDGRDSSAIADVECQLLVISKGQLLDLLRKFPAVKKEMKLVAAKRRAHHQKQINHQLGKLGEMARVQPED